jgi:predicted nucleic acid-binding protein
MPPVLFVDSNVLIEALLLPQSAAYVVAEMAARGVFDLVTSQLCVSDTEDAIVAKLGREPQDLEQAIINWEKLKTDVRLVVLKDSDVDTVLATRDKYLGLLRHKADIPVLAAALSLKPAPNVILSGNREHFNDRVAARCGIKIYSCQEFIEFLSEAP